MSLAIDVDCVVEVLIGGHWFPVADQSFCVDAYEFVSPCFHTVNESHRWQVNSESFEFKDRDGKIVAGPVSAIQAVRVDKR